LLAAMVIAGIVGVLIERFVYRPMLTRPRIVALIASIGLMICFSDVFRIVAGPNQLAFDMTSLRGGYAVAGVVISRIDAAILVGTAAIFVLPWSILQKTKHGFAIRGAALDIEAAQVMGINVGA